ncbi:DUF4142 domain-containing protein [Methylobacillus sp.]|uniref:DUF4142 domain-containing protein n=1 Tax=Methylobacillus sp. TaxID=56818 RepID=UPI0012CF0579|nr:DUF4142 domain-containing protein [Methylobacillus sp.]MPS49573.1 DUF4142 domain-containing protein [Methylobacillus sp.]
MMSVLWLRKQWLNLLAISLLASPILMLSNAAAAEALSAKDQGYLKDIARLGILQIEASELAVVKSSNEAVRHHAQEMIKIQAQLGEALKQIANQKRASLPKEPSLWQKAKLRSLSAKDGAEFDLGYAKTVGVKSQEEMVNLLGKIANRAEDPEIKAFALQHLSLATSNLETAKALLAVLKVEDD